MTATPMHEIKTAAAILDEDIVCRSFIQGSSTLAYACLLIRRKKYELAAHVLHSLEAKQASRFKDMVFYLQARIGMETGEFAMAKRRLLARVHQHPTDMVALSLLESCIYFEYEEWESRNPRPEDSSASSLPEASYSAGYDTESPDPAESASMPPDSDLEPESYAPVLSDHGLFGAGPSKVPDRAENASERPDSGAAEAPRAGATAASDPGAPRTPSPRRHSGDKEFGIYQSLADDANTDGMVLWNSAGRIKSTCRDPQLEKAIARIPETLPGPIADACLALEAGAVHKICFSFRNLTVTSFHRGPENMGLLTGPIGHSLLSMVRAENVFLKASAGSVPPGPGGNGDNHG